MLFRPDHQQFLESSFISGATHPKIARDIELHSYVLLFQDRHVAAIGGSCHTATFMADQERDHALSLMPPNRNRTVSAAKGFQAFILLISCLIFATFRNRLEANEPIFFAGNDAYAKGK